MKTHCTYRIRCHSRLNKPSRPTSLMVLASLLLVPICMAQGGNSPSATAKPLALSRADRNKVIYVSDFELDPSNFEQDKGGITGKGYLVPPPPKNLPSLRRRHQDPATAADNLIRLMSESLVSDLQKAGLTARRLPPTDALPTEGLLVSGVFTNLGEGNQMRRALLGFGAGKAKMELYVMVSDLTSAGQRLYGTSAQKSNGKRPGAVIALNPYVGAVGFVAKFGMTKNAPEKMVKKTASEIATELTRQLNTGVLAKN